jgi:endonuclease/exonuclease/phosphatase family metal-dependent hydrolase
MRLTVTTWNIAHASLSETVPPNANLGRITATLAAKNADFILLNELKNWDGPFGGGYSDVEIQARKIAQDLGMHFVSANTVATGLTGHMAVGVLSRYPLHGESYQEVSPGYGLIEVSADVPHTTPIRLYSLRFDHVSDAARAAGCNALRQRIQQLPVGTSAVAGGDFNTHRFNSWFAQLVDQAGLTASTNFMPGTASNPPSDADLIDHILTRGPATMSSASYQPAPPDTSDHPLVTALLELADTETYMTIAPVVYSNDPGLQEVYVAAQDSSHNPIDGAVLFDGKQVGTTFNPFTYKYKYVIRNVPAPGGGHVPTRILLPPAGRVRANGFPETTIHFEPTPEA